MVVVCHRSEEHTSELQSLRHLVCRLLLEKKAGADELPAEAPGNLAFRCESGAAASVASDEPTPAGAAELPAESPCNLAFEFFFLNAPAAPESSPLPPPAPLLT